MTTLVSSLLAGMRRAVFRLRVSSFGLILIPFLLLIGVGTLVYARLENWSLLESLYATIITITTVGYGDFSPQTFGGRLFAIFFTLIAIGLAGYAISSLAAIVFEYESTKLQRAILRQRMEKIQQLRDHVIICGASVLGHRSANEFLKRGQHFVLIEQDEETLRWALLWMHEGYVSKWREQFHYRFDTADELNLEEEETKSVAQLAEEMNILFMQEDPTDERQLLRAGIARAKGVVAAMADDRDNMSIILSARDMVDKLDNKQLRIISRVTDERNMRRLFLSGADKVISPNFMGGFSIASHMLDPDVGELWDRMLYSRNEVVRFSDMRLRQRAELAGRSAQAFKRETGLMVVAVKRDGEYLYGPDPDFVLELDDILITVGPVSVVEGQGISDR